MIKNLLRLCASFSFPELNPTVNIMFAVFLIEEWGLMKSLLWFSSLKELFIPWWTIANLLCDLSVKKPSNSISYLLKYKPG